jgi:hypothetical protein
MEIKEIVSYELNNDTNILTVSFRTIEDNEDVLRTDHVDYNIVEEYGFILETESLDFFLDNEEDDIFDIDENQIELDEDELMSFLNEYYTVNPKSIPGAEFF